MNTVPKISVIMSVYNGEDYLSEAIDSVCNQTFKDWELIIINDCSNDRTGEILKQYALSDMRIKVHTNETNLKLPSSLNKALSFAQGKYVARMDADDICLYDRLEKQYDFMEKHPDISLSSCRFMTLKQDVLASGGCGGKCDSESVKALLLVTNPILHPGIIAKTETMQRLKYDTSLTCTEDMELWTRIEEENLKIEIMPEYLMIYRLHDKQITETTLERQHNEIIKIQRNYYSKTLETMNAAREEFYINGVYFREKNDINKLCNFAKWIKSVNKKKKVFDKKALNYALFEILAEYKRNGISKGEMLKAMLCFDFSFLINEFKERKNRARKDGLKCIEAAKKMGYVHSGGTLEFPVFSKNKM